MDGNGSVSNYVHIEPFSLTFGNNLAIHRAGNFVCTQSLRPANVCYPGTDFKLISRAGVEKILNPMSARNPTFIFWLIKPGNRLRLTRSGILYPLYIDSVIGMAILFNSALRNDKCISKEGKGRHKNISVRRMFVHITCRCQIKR